MTEQTLQPAVERTIDRRRISIGIALIVTGLLIFLLFGLGSKPGELATFGMNSGGEAIQIPNLIVPVQPALYGLSLICIFVGAWQLARGGLRSGGWLIALIAFCFVSSFLVWATKEGSFNLVGMVSSTLGRATPIALAAMCGVISERTAVVNIAIEGIMLTAAMTSVIAATITHNLMIGLIVAILTG